MLKYQVYRKHQKAEQALQAMESIRRRTRAAAEAEELARAHEEIENTGRDEASAFNDPGSETVSGL